MLLAHALLLASSCAAAADNTTSSLLAEVVTSVSLAMKVTEVPLVSLAYMYRSGILSHEASATSRAVPRKVGHIYWYQ